MELAEIIDQISTYTGRFPRRAFEEAVRQQEAITPALLEILRDASRRVDEIDERDDYWGHMAALYLLAQFKETHAYPLMVEFFSIPGDKVKDICGDLITEDLARIFAAVWDGNDEPLKAIVLNPELNDYIRGCTLQTFTVLMIQGKKSRHEVVDYMKSLFNIGLEKEPSEVWDILVSEAERLYPEEVYEEIKSAYADELVDPFTMALEDVTDTLAKDKDAVLRALPRYPEYRPMKNIVDELAGWAAFNVAKKTKSRQTSREPMLVSGKTHVRDTGKTGRNDPCPCGSGKKYKKCCGK